MHLYGSEMNTTTTPYEASLGWIVNAQKPYIGKSILEEQKKMVLIKNWLQLLSQKGILQGMIIQLWMVMRS